MKLYYTSVVALDAIQLRPDLSLGGFKSANVVPNGSMHNLFSDVSVYSIMSKKDEYIALILRNETGTAIKNVKLWFVYPTGCQVVLSVSAVALNNGEMEYITTPYQSPYYAEFFEADGETSAVDLGNLANGEMIGLWFKKSINYSAIESQFSDANLAANGNPAEADEDIQIKIGWDALSSQTDFTDFSINGDPSTIDSNLHTVDCMINGPADITSLLPVFTLSIGASARVNGISQVSGATPVDFTNPTAYSIIAEDGVTTQDWTVTVTVAP